MFCIFYVAIVMVAMPIGAVPSTHTTIDVGPSSIAPDSVHKAPMQKGQSQQEVARSAVRRVGVQVIANGKRTVAVVPNGVRKAPTQKDESQQRVVGSAVRRVRVRMTANDKPTVADEADVSEVSPELSRTAEVSSAGHIKVMRKPKRSVENDKPAGGAMRCMNGPFSGREHAVMQYIDAETTEALFGIMSLRRQMAKFKMDADHVVLLGTGSTDRVKAMQEALCEIGVDRVVPVGDYIQSIAKECNGCEYKHFDKLFFFNQTNLGYKRAVSIDCDIFAAQPFDDVFKYQGVAMTHWLAMEYNSGVVVFEPDSDLFNKMIVALKLRIDNEKKKVPDKDPLRINGGDQGFLQAFLMQDPAGKYQLTELPNSFNVRAVSFGQPGVSAAEIQGIDYVSRYHKDQLKLIHFSMKPYRDQKTIVMMWKDKSSAQNPYMCDFIASMVDHLREHPQLGKIPVIGKQLSDWREFLHIQENPEFGEWIKTNCANVK